jgi:hypothetical protein
MRREVRHAQFVRYADDAVVHCLSERHAIAAKEKIAQRFAACGLELHPDKTRIVYCKDANRKEQHSVTQFTFLGFTFRPRYARSTEGVLFTSFLPALSAAAAKRMCRQIRWWHLPRRSPATLDEIAADCDATLTGWWNYYGSFYGSSMEAIFKHFDEALAFWARRKFKSLRAHQHRSHHWVRSIARRQPQLFIHWRLQHAKDLNNGSRVNREVHARFCERPRGKFGSSRGLLTKLEMTKRVIDLRSQVPLLDMPHAAYPTACRRLHYAEVGSCVSWRTPLSAVGKRFAKGCAFVVRHIFASSQRAEELQQAVVGTEATRLDPVRSGSCQRGFLQRKVRVKIGLSRVN